MGRFNDSRAAHVLSHHKLVGLTSWLASQDPAFGLMIRQS